MSGGYFHNGPADAVQKVVLVRDHFPERIRLLRSTDVLSVRSSMEGGSFGIGTAAAVVVLLGFLYMLFRPDPYKNQKKASRRSVAA